MTSEQAGVLKGIGCGAALTFGIFLAPIFLTLPVLPDDLAGLLRVWLILAALNSVWLVVCIARLARHRFLTPEDILGGAADTGTGRARVLQSLLQNTLEQTVVAIVASGAWLFTAPEGWRFVAVLCCGAFTLGRLLFICGYKQGAAARALGFALTFYPSTALLAGALMLAAEMLLSA